MVKFVYNYKRKEGIEMTNAYYRSSNSIERQISNLSYSEFIFEGRKCNSFEGFYQGIKGSGEDMQNHVFLMFGMEAKGRSKPTSYVYFNGRKLKAGSKDHHELLFEAQKCKYTQCQKSREALLATGNTKITHKVGRDSDVYPAKVYTKHLTTIRAMIQKGEL